MLTDRLRTVGAVEANERGLAQISTRFPGWIETLATSETGTLVKRGQVLATLYSPVVLEAQEELLSALRWSGGGGDAAAPLVPGAHGGHGGGDGLVLDARHRLELLGIAPQEIEAIVRERKSRRAIGIRSPVDGHVIARRVTAGMAVQPGTPLFEIADLRSVWVLADIYEADAARVRVGQPARFRIATYPGEVFKGKVSFVYPLLDSESRTLRVRLELPNPAGTGGHETAARHVRRRRAGAAAIVRGHRAQRGGGRHRRICNTCSSPRAAAASSRARSSWAPGWVTRSTITSGLEPGELVVTTANFLIDSESRLRAAIEPAR